VFHRPGGIKIQRLTAFYFSFGIFLFVIALLTVGCGGGNAILTDPQRPATVEPSTLVVTPSAALLMPGQTLQFSSSENGASITPGSWMVNNIAGGAAATGTITASGLYIAPATATPTSVQITAANASGTTQSAPAHISFFNSTNFKTGTVAGTANPLVALYTFTAPQGSTVQVKFGTTTAYGLTTWTQPAPPGGGDISIQTAGMRASTTYHMQAIVHLFTGELVTDTDKTFTTGAIPPDVLPNITIQQPAGASPASGVEMLNLFSLNPTSLLTAVVTDLDGNVIWYYPNQPNSAFPLKPLANGHLLIGTNSELREIDLAGNTLFTLPIVQVQSRLAAIGLAIPPLVSIHHDMLKLPNGHYLFLANFNQTVPDQAPPGTVLADIIVDWDPQQGPVWTWNAFDHLSLSHAPEGTTDWTHANALVYSPDDGNLILSMRNQNWVIKINYADGVGDGSVLWRLGPDGDFTLPVGFGPIEWNYGQHYPVLLGPNTTGIFPLMIFNNGTVRYVDAANTLCGNPGVPACYSSVPIFQLNEYDKTVQVLSEINLSPSYSVCCGSVGQLANGDIEYDIAADVASPMTSTVQEVTSAQNPQPVWQMTIKGILAYRAFRIPSLYPGVVWSQSALATAHAAAKPGARSVASTLTTTHGNGP
jgi:arylsulfate sulfotransferase